MARGVIHEIAEHGKGFLLAFAGILALTFSVLFIADLLPDHAQANTSQDAVVSIQATATPSVSKAAAEKNGELPVRIVATSIGLSAKVSNPTSANVSVLDEALLTGSARYPSSALLGVDGTMLLFGHSSYLPVVHNQAYKTFDGIQNLKVGDMVSVYSQSNEYRYKVTGVATAQADADVVALPSADKHLVLVTCDSFATKNTRFVVSADFVGTYPLVSK